MNWQALFLAILCGIVLVILIPVIFNLIVVIFAASLVAFFIFTMYYVFRDILERK